MLYCTPLFQFSPIDEPPHKSATGEEKEDICGDGYRKYTRRLYTNLQGRSRLQSRCQC